MAQVIQCPTCAKKFKLPDRPPATFTCTGCATVMDLSAFRTATAAAAPAAEPAAAASAGAAASGGAKGARTGGSPTRSARTGGAGGGGSGSTRTSSVRRRAREEDGGDGGDGGREGLAPPKDNSKVLILGSIAGVVVIGAVAFLLLNRDKPAPPAPPKDAGAATAGATTPQPPPTAGKTPAPAGGMAGATPTPAPDAGMETPAAAGGDKPAPTPSAPRGPGAVKEVGHHPDATEDEKKNIDHLIDVAIFQNAGRDSRDAEQQLVAIGIKAAPRLINVFNTVKLQEGFENRLGKMKAGIADRALRSIDGYIDRTSRGKATLVTAASDPKFVETIAKRWNNWWDSGAYKEPKKPWDERTEGNRGEKADPTDKDNPGTTDGK